MSVLDDLVEQARLRAAQLQGPEPTQALAPGRFLEALRGKDRLKVLAEYKRQSPSLGVVRDGLDEVQQVRTYEKAGAAAVSVLTEPTRFAGRYQDLQRASGALAIPTLMKDFVVDPAQVRQAVSLGAAAVLLIVRCLSSETLQQLVGCCRRYGLGMLVECHEASEVQVALDLGPDVVIGVNRRNLATLAIEPGLAVQLLAKVPSDRVVVAESGYESPEDTQELRGLADAVLVGSALMRSPDPADFIRRVSG